VFGERGSLMPRTETKKMQKEGERTDFVDKMGCASIAYNYDCDELGGLHATMQSKTCYIKICEVRD
jgi:hypothetical protein